MNGNIAILASYGIMCGVAEYGRNLAEALRRLGHQVTLFGSRGGGRIRPEHRWQLLPDVEGEPDVVRCFDAPAWSYGGEFDMPLVAAEFERRAIAAVIVQYQSMIYDTARLEEFLAWCHGRGVRTVVTYHDSCFARPLQPVDAAVVHGRGMQALLPGATIIPQGVHQVPELTREEACREYGFPDGLVATLGLGRTRYDVILRAAERLGWSLLVSDPTGSCQIESPRIIAARRWLDQRDMIRMLMAARGVVLWYPPVAALVTSSAAQVAAASHRLVIVTDTNWFADLPSDVFIKVTDEDQLVQSLLRGEEPERKAHQHQFIRANSWTEVARRYAELCR